MTIEQRLSNIESRLDSLQESFIQSQRNAVEVTAKADNGNSKVPQVDINTLNISDNSDGLFDVAALADENSEAIMELAQMISEMEG